MWNFILQRSLTHTEHHLWRSMALRVNKTLCCLEKTQTPLLCSRSDSRNSKEKKCTYWFGTMLVYVMPGSVISPITRLLVPVSPWRQCAKLLGIVPVAANWETTETEFEPNPINPSVASSELAKFPVRTFPHLLPVHPRAGSKFSSSYKSLSLSRSYRKSLSLKKLHTKKPKKKK